MQKTLPALTDANPLMAGDICHKRKTLRTLNQLFEPVASRLRSAFSPWIKPVSENVREDSGA